MTPEPFSPSYPLKNTMKDPYGDTDKLWDTFVFHDHDNGNVVSRPVVSVTDNDIARPSEHPPDDDDDEPMDGEIPAQGESTSPDVLGEGGGGEKEVEKKTTSSEVDVK
jgi:hypothetical protein